MQVSERWEEIPVPVHCVGCHLCSSWKELLLDHYSGTAAAERLTLGFCSDSCPISETVLSLKSQDFEARTPQMFKSLYPRWHLALEAESVAVHLLCKPPSPPVPSRVPEAVLSSPA